MGTIQGTPYPKHRDAIQYTAFWPVFLAGLYPTTRGVPDARRHLKVETELMGVPITYRLFANCNQEGGQWHVVFYAAYNAHTQRTEYAIAPDDVQTFADRAAIHATMAGNFFGFTGNHRPHELQTSVMMHRLMTGDVKGALSAWKQSWTSALKDPTWWMVAAPTTLAAAGSASKAAASAAGAETSAAARLPQAAAQPSMVRAMQTQADLLSKAPSRRLIYLEKPEVFRHTLTQTPLSSSYASIEKSGMMRLSTGANAHYGEGIYVWSKGATGGGTYIDIRVPAGTTAELLVFSDGKSWYRLVPASGDTLRVEIVGTNLTAQEIAEGRLLVGP